MRKIIYLLALVVTLTLGSCITDAQVSYGYGYYDYERPSITIVYRNSIPYYYVWEELNGWVYRLVPPERIPYIRHGYRPIPNTPRHAPYSHPQPLPQPIVRQPMNGRPNMRPPKPIQNQPRRGMQVNPRTNMEQPRGNSHPNNGIRMGGRR